MATVTNLDGSIEEVERKKPDTICVVVDDSNETQILDTAKKLPDVAVYYSKDASEYIGQRDLSNVKFIINDFDGALFTNIREVTSKIFGPTVIEQCVRYQQPLPVTTRPLYCGFMNKLVACFTGFKLKEELTRLIGLIHHMGGSVRKDFSPSVTHLIANSTSGEKYQYAVNLGRPVVSPKWVFTCWEHRNEVDFSISSLVEAEYGIQPFLSCKICFCGFPAEEQLHMEEMTALNGGTVCCLNSTGVTHIVMANEISNEKFDNETQMEILQSGAVLVKVEWFWISIQINARANDRLYLVEMTNENGPTCGTPYSAASVGTRSKKRKRLKDTLGHLASLSDLEGGNLSAIANSSAFKQRRSEELAMISCSPSILDTTMSPSSSDENAEIETHEKSILNSSLWNSNDHKPISPRMQVACELLQTENNYVGILNTIITVVKDPIENINQVGGPILDPTEVKIIFGNVRPLYDVHIKLKEDLMDLVNCWKEDNCIGNIIVKYSQELLKAYPPFINFFEKTKEFLLKCDNTKPRFHAFLKICQGKPEFGRQSLVELLIRPVQRLPSVILLLGDLLKHTSKSNPDHAALEEAIKCLKEIMVNINEDKRKTEGQVAMFKLVNDIENCPPNLLSSHRHFIASMDVVELGNCVIGKGEPLTLFLFSDVVEICKRRKCVTNSSSTSSSSPTMVVRSTSVVSLHSSKSYQKRYKHLELLQLSHIKLVADVNETDDCHNVFALVCRGNQDLKERLYSFVLLLDEQEILSGAKSNFLRLICRNIANVLCRQDVESFLKCVEPPDLDIFSSDLSTKTLSKAARFASKTSKKVGRVLSFTSKTPRKLTRAVSTMLSPLTRGAVDGLDQDGFATPLAVAAKRFPCASTLNLQNYESPKKISASPGLGKKIKSFTLGPSSLLKRTWKCDDKRQPAMEDSKRRSVSTTNL